MIRPNLDKLRIVYYPDPVLKEVCPEVTDFGSELRALTDRMLEVMHTGRGVGLAAPQVGLRLRLFVCNATGEPGDNMVCVNPRFTELTGAAEAEEGCLSLPGINVTMRRAARAVMQAHDADGRPFEAVGEDLLARVWQHESDHLDGHLIIDHMSPTDEIANRRAVKQLKEQYAGSR
jgi:peptide deformylase